MSNPPTPSRRTVRIGPGAFLAALALAVTAVPVIAQTAGATKAVAALTPTTTTLGAVPTAANYGANITLTAQVAATSGTPTGLVNFSDGNTALGSVELTDGAASLVVNTLVVGVHPEVKATYAGDATFATSLSNTVTLTISKTQPVVTLTLITPNPTTAFSNTTFLATVTAPTGSPPELFGSLQLNGVQVDVMTPNPGNMNRVTRRVPPGTWAVTAVYPESQNFFGAVSAPVSMTVNGNACFLDVNGDFGTLDGYDGRTIMAWLAGTRGDALAAVSRLPTWSTPSGAEIDLLLTPQQTGGILDLDGDGLTLANSDGLMLLRVLLGLRGAAVLANATTPAATRTSWTDVRDYLNTTCALNLP